jgi:hypothetical protein
VQAAAGGKRGELRAQGAVEACEHIQSQPLLSTSVANPHPRPIQACDHAENPSTPAQQKPVRPPIQKLPHPSRMFTPALG